MRHGIMGLLFLVGTGFAEDLSHVDKMVKSYVSQKEFMGSILVARGDQVLFNKGYGFANLEWDIPNTPATKFRIGSLPNNSRPLPYCFLRNEES
jgi:hypothetical protein